MTIELRRWRLLTVAVLAATTLAACGSGADTPEETTEVEFLLPFAESIFYYGITVARDMGYFAEEGLEVETQDTGGSGFVTQQIAGGGFDYGFNTPAETLAALGSGQDMIVTFNQETGNIFGVRVPEDSDIQSVEDLEGKTLGITDFGGGEVPLVTAVLGEVGLGFDEEVEIQVVGPGGPLAFSSLQDGTVDAFAGAVNDWAALEAQGLRLRDILPPEFNEQPGDVIVMRRETWEDAEGRDVAVRLARAIAKGLYFGQLDHDAGLCIAKEFLPEEHEDPDFARAYFEEVAQLQEPVAPDQWGFNDLQQWDFIQQLLIQGGDLEAPIDLEQHITNEPLEEINDWDRSAVEADAEESDVRYPEC